MRLGQTETTTAPVVQKAWYEKVLDTFQQAVPIAAQAYTQKELLQLNMQRAKQGLPPIDTTQYSPAVQVTTDPAMKNIMLIGLGILAVAVLTPVLKKKR